ncbi:Hsp20/alpha crystallin family protein [Pseudoclavibacter soli]|uniref:Hsp20/alpha crystallin family protein n=1 Tax=Pseudoclavibacter soli TaxID=452623 RepID=UPI0004196913|nr:Hsp20/alpha crystallin family protein [Pseudoclavibacter soli]
MAMVFDPFREIDRLVTGAAQQGPKGMPVDLYREGDHYVLVADIPGVDPGSIDVDLDGQQLSIRAERSARSGEAVQWIAHERPAGTYLRQLTLGDGLDVERIAATYENGVLTLTIPVSAKARPRKIQVTSSPAAEVPTVVSAEPHEAVAEADGSADAAVEADAAH